MSRGSIRRLVPFALPPALAVALSLGLSACGGDGDSPTSVTPPPNVAGGYFLEWTLQVLRKSDGFQTQFRCFGSLTLVQGVAAGSTATLSGYAAVTSGCTPESYDLSGTVSAGGAVEFTTGGPNPPQGPCPGGTNVRFSGQVTTRDSSATLTARGVSTVTCPLYGEHEFTYLLSGRR